MAKTHHRTRRSSGVRWSSWFGQGARPGAGVRVRGTERPMAPLIKRVVQAQQPQGTVPELCLSNGIETCHAFMRFREALSFCIVWDTFCR